MRLHLQPPAHGSEAHTRPVEVVFKINSRLKADSGFSDSLCRPRTPAPHHAVVHDALVAAFLFRVPNVCSLVILLTNSAALTLPTVLEKYDG